MARRTRLTSFSKLLITLFIVGGIYFGYVYLRDNGYLEIPDTEATNNTKKNSKKVDTNIKMGKAVTDDDDIIKVGVVTWGGYAGGQYYNEGFEPTEASRFYKDYGFALDFEILDDFVASRDAFKSGEVDLLWATIDAFPTEVENLKQYDPQVVFQADWSRGGDAIVVRRGINTVGDLKGKKVAVALLTPSHTFLIKMLQAGGLTQKDIELVEMGNAIDAAAAFQSKRVDAAVVWSPDDQACLEKVRGSKILQNTKTASHIIADVFFAKKDFIKQNEKRLQQLYEGWMKGAAEINNSDAAKEKAAKILAKGLKVDEVFAANAIDNVRLTNHGDNLNFFGKNRDYRGTTGEDLYNDMSGIYHQLGHAPANVRSWRLIANDDIVSGVSFEGDDTQLAEGQKRFEEAKEEDVAVEAISTKQVSIRFASGQYTLDENAKYIIDEEFANIAKSFSNTRIRIEGNTDDIGDYDKNVELSRKRAQAVADFLMEEYGFPESRFVIVGNGPDKPIAKCKGIKTPSCRSSNRRTDFELLPD